MKPLPLTVDTLKSLPTGIYAIFLRNTLLEVIMIDELDQIKMLGSSDVFTSNQYMVLLTFCLQDDYILNDLHIVINSEVKLPISKPSSLLRDYLTICVDGTKSKS